MSSLAGIERAPCTFVIVVAYGVLALATGLMTPDLEQLLRFGALVGALVPEGGAWRLLAYSMLHGGLLHLLFNSVALLSIGPALEQRLGSLRFCALYLISALGGGLLVLFWNGPLQPVVGGSGAVFGMLGAALAIHMRQGRHLLDFLNYYGPRQLLGTIVANLVLGLLLPMVSNAGHIGGLVAGFVLAFGFLEPSREPRDRLDRVIQAGCAAILISATVYALRPVVRWDWLDSQWREARAAGDRERAQALEEALQLLPARERGERLQSMRPR